MHLSSTLNVKGERGRPGRKNLSLPFETEGVAAGAACRVGRPQAPSPSIFLIDVVVGEPSSISL
ncbi:hypothetical protein PHLCEN_2v919 [Hermanssonia centrifuga]|uniref:Uncharacterized protein n=1 Tax=Hermanssonia centrifuga TaxID=98765 RepID=A0A2R6S4K9_9APHY|nr:hypothetical protein PHLCEN_2v919 [Hermanssonia centrifuga]